MSSQIRVLVYDGPHEMHIETRPRPKPEREDVLVRIAYVGICGSDLHGYTGESGRRAPGMVMGHEASGWVEEVGDAVDGLSVGDAVTFNPAIPCSGRCGHEQANRCDELRVVGVTPDIQGAFADSLLVNSARVVPLGDLDLKIGAMAEPLAVAFQTVKQAGVKAGDEVLIIGGGMIGQCVARAARQAGAASVVISEAMEDRRRQASEADFRAIDPDEVAGLPAFDVAVDAVGITPTAEAAIRAVKKGGVVGFVGLGLPEVTIPLFDVVVPERTIVGSFCYADEIFEDAVATAGSSIIDLESLLGGVVDFDEAHDAFESLATGERKDLKVLVATGAERPE